MVTDCIVPTGPLSTNCHLVLVENDEKLLFVIDPGAEPELIIAAAQTIPHDRARILLTHAHIDHISAAGAVAKALNVEFVELAPEDMELYNDKSNCFLPYFKPAVSLPPCKPFDNIPECRVLPLPGHTPGGSGFLFNDGKNSFLISGDTIFSGSIGRTDLPGGNYGTLISSIRTRIMPLPENLVIYPGHGSATTVGFERVNNPYIYDN